MVSAAAANDEERDATAEGTRDRAEPGGIRCAGERRTGLANAHAWPPCLRRARIAVAAHRCGIHAACACAADRARSAGRDRWRPDGHGAEHRQPSPWIVGEQLIVGFTGQGNLIIQDGGMVVSRTPGSAPAGSLGRLPGSVGSVTVTGVGSIWENLNGELQIGQSGHGILLISDGGLVRDVDHLRHAHRRQYAGPGRGDGHGLRVQHANAGRDGCGLQRPGPPDHSCGGHRQQRRVGRIANNPNSIGDALVTGSGSTWTNTRHRDGRHRRRRQLSRWPTAARSSRCVVSPLRRMRAPLACSTSALPKVRRPSRLAPCRPPTVTFGAGTGRIVFNHTDASGAYSFVPLVAGAGQVVVLSGTTVLSANNTYSGGTTLGGGVLQIASDANLGARFGRAGLRLRRLAHHSRYLDHPASDARYWRRHLGARSPARR